MAEVGNLVWVKAGLRVRVANLFVVVGVRGSRMSMRILTKVGVQVRMCGYNRVQQKYQHSCYFRGELCI